MCDHNADGELERDNKMSIASMENSFKYFFQ